jgi:hypothetical protein
MSSTILNPKGVELLKKATDVSGKKLIKENFTDKQIDDQISLLIGMKIRTEDSIKHEQSRIVNAIDYSLPKEDVYKFINSEMKNFLGFNGEVIDSFWHGFGSALMYKEHESKSKANIGMDRIFGNSFDNCYSFIYGHKTYIQSIIESYEFKASTSKKEVFSSPYNTLEELEENVTIKNGAAQAKIFWMDKSKSMEERMLAFETHGKCNDWMHQPKHMYLKQLFDYMLSEEMEDIRRGAEEECSQFVDSWIYKLESNRVKISYAENQYHPKLVKTERGYKPSKAAIERLTNYYYEILMEEGISSFIVDW